MSYDASENSTRLGSPIELYKFVIGVNEWLYTSQEDLVIDGIDNYIPIPIQRSGLEFEGEPNKGNIRISMGRSEGIALEFIVQPPAVPVLLYIYRYHGTDFITNKETIWSGRVLDVSWSGSFATFNCESIYTSINRFGLTRTYGPSCPFILYGDGCQVDQNNHKTTTNVVTLTNNVIQSDDFIGFANNYFAGGFMNYLPSGQPTQYRGISASDGTAGTITMAYSLPGLGTGSTINAFAGCAHNLEDCTNKFNNLVRYGGFPYNPTLNPFNGTTLY